MAATAPLSILKNSRLSVLRNVFLHQSFFDSTQLQQATLPQTLSERIIGSTLIKSPSVKGRIIALHPNSKTPVTVQPGAEVGSSGSSAFTLIPGQKAKIHGNGFRGLDWGLPVGWLGGGLATLLVADDEEALLDWTTVQSEVVFHRLRLAIVSDAANPSATPTDINANWPIHFPWRNAFRYNTAQPTVPAMQGSQQPELTVSPTRIALRLRVSNLTSPTPMRLIWQGNSILDEDSTGTVGFSDYTAIDVNWPAAQGTTTPFPVIELPTEAMQFGGDSAVLTLTDLGNTSLTSKYVDIVRYGRL
jgi:hypothetical protein